MGDAGQLVYGLAADSPHLAVEPSTGLVYVVSLLGLSSGTIEAEVTATDPAGLGAVTTVEVRPTRCGKPEITRNQRKNSPPPAADS